MQNLFSMPIIIDDLGNNQKTFNISADKNQLEEIKQILKVEGVESFKSEIKFKLYKKEHLLKVWGTADAELELKSVISLTNFVKKYHTEFETTYDTKATPQEIKEIDLELDLYSETPEFIIDGTLDVATIAIEQIALILDDHPKRETESFNFTSEFDEETTAKMNPFSALKQLKK